MNCLLAMDGAGGGIGGLVGMVIWLAVVVVIVAGLWKTFVKAGQPGWAALVPIYNLYILTKVAGRPAWWTVLFFLPLVNIVAAAVISVDVARAFGKSLLFSVGLFLLAPVFYCILGFTDAAYGGPKPLTVDEARDLAAAAS